MKTEFEHLISNELLSCVERTIQRTLEKPELYRPFHTALLSKEVIFWSSFERSFSTSFGSRVIEEIARLVVLSNGASKAERQKETFINIDRSYADQITYELQQLRDGSSNVDKSFDKTVCRIMNVPCLGEITTVRVISDLWWEKDGTQNFISLKTVMPNLDQTEIAKKDCLNLKVAFPDCNAYFGLPYNPYGEDKSSYAHSLPKKIFDFQNDSNVLIGKELWDTLGGPGTYYKLIEIAESVGNQTKQLISSKFKL